MTLTTRKEDYIKTILKLQNAHMLVTNKLLASTLEVSAPSVSEMLNKLQHEKLVFIEKPSQIILTNKGMLLAQEIQRRHHLCEVFLYSVLAYDLDRIHHDAEYLEHLESDLFFDKLDTFLNYPSTCPHGSTIERIKKDIE